LKFFDPIGAFGGEELGAKTLLKKGFTAISKIPSLDFD